jgi:hypothetical protein
VFILFLRKTLNQILNLLEYNLVMIKHILDYIMQHYLTLKPILYEIDHGAGLEILMVVIFMLGDIHKDNHSTIKVL